MVITEKRITKNQVEIVINGKYIMTNISNEEISYLCLDNQIQGIITKNIQNEVIKKDGKDFYNSYFIGENGEKVNIFDFKGYFI